MERVSFEAAKALKKAGYSQFDDCHYYNCDGEKFINPEEGTLEEDDYCNPTVMRVWLWLWRKKHCYIQPVLFKNGIKAYIFNNGQSIKKVFSASDPEEAFKAAIEYLAENDLIK